MSNDTILDAAITAINEKTVAACRNFYVGTATELVAREWGQEFAGQLDITTQGHGFVSIRSSAGEVYASVETDGFGYGLWSLRYYRRLPADNWFSRKLATISWIRAGQILRGQS